MGMPLQLGAAAWRNRRHVRQHRSTSPSASIACTSIGIEKLIADMAPIHDVTAQWYGQSLWRDVPSTRTRVPA